jgi:hypothetical protein
VNARQIAAALRQLADEIERPETESGPKRRGRRTPAVPAGPIDELTAARARQALLKAGMIGVK